MIQSMQLTMIQDDSNLSTLSMFRRSRRQLIRTDSGLVPIGDTVRNSGWKHHYNQETLVKIGMGLHGAVLIPGTWLGTVQRTTWTGDRVALLAKANRTV